MTEYRGAGKAKRHAKEFNGADVESHSVETLSLYSQYCFLVNAVTFKHESIHVCNSLPTHK